MAKTIVLVGQPNAGKSTLFNVLSDIKISTSNFAGTTVKLNQTEININGEIYRLIDLPGTYSLNPTDAAETLTLNYLLNEQVDLIINVVDATLLARSLELTVELVELGLPMVIALNMQDEAEKHGVKIDSKKLEELLNIPVIPTIALLGKGVKKLVDICDDIVTSGTKNGTILEYTHHIEESLQQISGKFSPFSKELKGNLRFYSIKALENPAYVPSKVMAGIWEFRDRIEEENRLAHKKDAFETISYERHHLAMQLSHDISTLIPRKQRPFTEKIDNILLHPFYGHIFGFAFLFLYFFTIFIVGSGITWLIDIPIKSIPGLYEGLRADQPFLWHTVDGIAQGLMGGIGIVLPYFIPLLFLTALFEETGYLARIAFLLDGLFHKIGLHGKSIVPFIMGFGCAVPALYGTRIMENKRDRTITAILLNFIPCSARISVIFSLAAAFTGPIWAVVVFLFVGIVVTIIGKLLTIFLKKPQGLILEIPNLKVPSIRISAKKTLIKINDFVKVALPFLIAGSIILGWLDYFKVTDFINSSFSFLITGLLDLPEKLGSTLVFGFLRKELVVVMATQSLGVANLSDIPLTLAQAVTFIIFVIFYIPCVSTLAVLYKEFGSKIAIYSVLISIFVATFSAFIFKILLNI